MESTIVIKVKYGETLRRFNARIVDQELDVDLDGLREKVLDLFKFAPDADLTLTYIDEDGDVVTLADEEDLHDVIRQSLNPLRITVTLNTERSGTSYARSSGNSTPMISPGVQHSLNTGDTEILKSVPGPLSEAVSKLSKNLTLKPESSPQAVAELVDTLSRMGLSYLKQFAEFQPSAELSKQNGATGSNVVVSSGKDQKGSDVEGVITEMLPSTKSEAPNLEVIKALPNAELPDLNSNEEDPDEEDPDEEDLVNLIRGVEAPVMPPPGSVNLNVGLPDDSFLFGWASVNPTPGNFHVAVDDKKEEVKNLGEGHSSVRSIVLPSIVVPHVDVTPVANNIPAEKNKEIRPSESHIGGMFVTPLFPHGVPFKNLGEDGSSGRSYILPHVNGTPVANNVPVDDKNKDIKELSESHLGGMFVGGGTSLTNPYLPPAISSALANGSIVPPCYAPPGVPFKRSYNHSDGFGSIFHRGVRCDGCGVHPITGPRFKSSVKEDYDLCNICFKEMGNEADYIRMDRPLTCRQPLPSRGLSGPHCRLRPPTLPTPAPLRGFGMKPNRPKLDSRFIKDVNVLDGTIMAPSTPFTKIWRMKNNGTVVWPQGTTLLCIGGDRLSEVVHVELEIPADGLPVDKELDIAVDFSAPELPGRYVSYWRMTTPSGQKFGQRVWVLIQVDASLKDSWFESTHGLNLNLPPLIGSMTAPQIVDVNDEPFVKDSFLEPDYSNRATELVEPIVYASPNKDQELNFPINDTLLVGGGASKPTASEASSSSVSYPIIDLSELPPMVPYPARSPIVDVPASAQGESGNNDVETNLLRELEQMGFKQVDLNKEILRMNEYNLEQSVDDLCGMAEWDPILDELQEMGFCDDETNKRLLKKNNGSIKRVVMDLLNGEKA